MVRCCEGETPSTAASLSRYYFPFSLQEECQNYVRVLIVAGRKVFMCGTNAFSPVCSSRQVGGRLGWGGRKGTDTNGFPHSGTVLEWRCQM